MDSLRHLLHLWYFPQEQGFPFANIVFSHYLFHLPETNRTWSWHGEKQLDCWKREARSIYYVQYKPPVELNFCHWLISNCMMTRVRLMNDMWYTDCSARLESWTFPLRNIFTDMEDRYCSPVTLVNTYLRQSELLPQGFSHQYSSSDLSFLSVQQCTKRIY